MKLTTIVKTIVVIAILLISNAYAQGPGKIQQIRVEFIKKDLNVSEDKATEIASILDQCWKKQRVIVMDTLLTSVSKDQKMKIITAEKNHQLNALLTGEQFEQMRSLPVRLKRITDSIRKGTGASGMASKHQK